MIFYIKLKKLKKLNNRSSSPSFTLIELILVLIIISILILSINLSIPNDKLRAAADEIVLKINYTHNLALKDDKYYPFPKNTSLFEQNKSKYWFKQWWQIKFTNAGNDIIMYIFSDSADKNTANFNKKIIHKQLYELAKINDKYLIGASKEETNNNQYPTKINIDKTMNLTKYFNIKSLYYTGYSASKAKDNNIYFMNRFSLIFDNQGNVFQNEGKTGDKNDVISLDFNRRLLTKKVSIKICSKENSIDNCKLTNNNFCIINITTSGFAYIEKCKY